MQFYLKTFIFADCVGVLSSYVSFQYGQVSNYKTLVLNLEIKLSHCIFSA